MTLKKSNPGDDWKFLGNDVLDTDKQTTLVSLTQLESLQLSEEDVDQTKEFLGMQAVAKKNPAKCRSNASVCVHTDALKELAIIKDHPVYPEVKNWLSTKLKNPSSFKDLQVSAAQRIARMVLSNQDVLLDKDFDKDDYLQSIEDEVGDN